MNKKKKNRINTVWKILLFALLFFIIFFYVFYSAPYWNKSIPWKDIEISTLKLKDNGPEYKISKGVLYKNGKSRKIKFELNPFKLVENDRVLRLALFYQITKEDPLFTGPGVNTSSYIDSVKKLSSVNNKIKQDFGLDADVVPSDFLSKVGEIYKVSNDFSVLPKVKSARELTSLYSKANISYFNSAKSLKEKIKGKNKTMVQISSVTSLDVIRGDIDKIINNSSSLKEAIAKRKNCLNISTLFCSRNYLKDISVSPYNPKDVQSARILEKEDLYYTKNPENMEIGIPYEIKSPCFRANSDDNIHYIYAIKESLNNGQRLIPKIADNNYYREMKSDNAEDIDIYYKRHNISWRPMFVTTPYACNNLEYQTDLATVDYYWNKYKDDSLISNIVNSITDIPKEYSFYFNEAQRIEKIFSNEKYPRYETVKALSNVYKNIYNVLIKEANSEVNNSWLEKIYPIKDDILERALIVERKTAQLEQLISFFSYILEGYAETTPILDFGNEDKDYVYQVRSGYSFTYLGFSDSVWRNEEKLNYIEDVPRQLGYSIVEYDQAVNILGKELVNYITSFNRNDIWYEITGKKIE